MIPTLKVQDRSTDEHNLHPYRKLGHISRFQASMKSGSWNLLSSASSAGAYSGSAELKRRDSSPSVPSSAKLAMCKCSTGLRARLLGVSCKAAISEDVISSVSSFLTRFLLIGVKVRSGEDSVTSSLRFTLFFSVLPVLPLARGGAFVRGVFGVEVAVSFPPSGLASFRSLKICSETARAVGLSLGLVFAMVERQQSVKYYYTRSVSLTPSLRDPFVVNRAFVRV